MTQSQPPLDVFCSYAHQDEALCQELQAHLAVLERQGLIRLWHDRQIGAGQEWAGEIDANLEAADLVLLLVSPDFIASDYCWDVEARRALERHEARQAVVIPVVLRPVDFQDVPIGRLQALPEDARAVTAWGDRDAAFRDVARGVRIVVEREMKRRREAGGARTAAAAPVEVRLRSLPPPKFPELPYPVLLPYTHPDLLGGRDRELGGLQQSLRLPIAILGLYAPSGIGKSSLLLGGLAPRLRQEEVPVALERYPHEVGLARRLLGDLLKGDGIGAEVDDYEDFVERLGDVERLAGKTPVLILDQFESVLRRDDAEPARARLGVLMAATLRRRPQPPCRWLLGYREEFHGEVLAWLGDVLADARRQGLAGIDGLPHDLATPDRFHARSLAPLGEPLAGGEPVAEAAKAFRAAIESPLRLRREDGRWRYPCRFAGDGAERLARAFAEARLARPEAPLTPELQVVLAHLLTRSGNGDLTATGSWREVVEIQVPEDPGTLIDEALEGHLERALEAAFPTGKRGAERHRARALLALRELATATGQPLSAGDLAQAIGEDGEEVLEWLATPQTRLVVARDAPEGLSYGLSHDRMAEVVVRMVEEEGQYGKLLLDAGLLRLRRFVALETALFRSGEQPAPRLSRRHFAGIAANAKALLWDDERRTWWAACRRRRRADQVRLVSWSMVSAAVLALLVVWVGKWATERAELRALFKQVAQAEPATAFSALDQLRRKQIRPEVLLQRLSQRPEPSIVLERGLEGLEGEARSEAVLATVALMLPLVEERPEDPVRIANLVWALDFGPRRDPAFARRAWEMRQQVLAPLRHLRPLPATPGAEDSDWIEIPAGSFLMGTGEDEAGNADERPRHEVTLSGFRLQRHEVTLGEFRRLVPDHLGVDDEDDLVGPDYPVRFVSWYQAYTYAAWLGGRLPTEAEWEYAARAGCGFAYCDAEGRETTLDAVAWVLRNSRDGGEIAPRPVMRRTSNPWGLHDLLGNLNEWALDWPRGYSTAPQLDPWGMAGPPSSGVVRVARGGSFMHEAILVRVATRFRRVPSIGGMDHGFRVALSLPMAPGRPPRAADP